MCRIQVVNFFKAGFNLLHDAQLRDAVARSQSDRRVGDVDEDDLDLAAIARVYDTGQRGDALDRKAAAIFDERTVASWKRHRQAGRDQLCFMRLDSRGVHAVQVGRQVAEGAGVCVLRQAGFGVKTLDRDVWATSCMLLA